MRFQPSFTTWVEAAINREYMSLPLTVECQVKLFSKRQANVILADGYRTAIGYQILSNHWTISTQPETGELTVFLQNMQPSELNSHVDVADSKWHDIALVFEIDRAALYLDGVQVAAEALTPRILTHPLGDWSNEGPLYFGCFPPDAQSCDGEIGVVRISRAARSISPEAADIRTADSKTIGLWRFDLEPAAGLIPDLSKTKNPARIKRYQPTLDENDYVDFGVKTNPFDRPLLPVTFATSQREPAPHGRSVGIEEILLHGTWDCTWVESCGRSEQQMLESPEAWKDAFPANVPCSVQTALLENGLIEDPMVDRNNLHITWVTDREWWLRKSFTAPEEWRGKKITLLFDGVDYRATFWLNGVRLGQHEGMFGGPEFDVTPLLRYQGQENQLVVCLDPAPINYEDTFKNNVAYGWHYVKLVTLGIWRPVHLIARGETALDSPFLTTQEILPDGVKAALSLDLHHYGHQPQLLTLEVALTPRNFAGQAYRFEQPIQVQPGANHLGFSGKLPDARLWWPAGLGEPSLYTFECQIKQAGQVIDRYRANWGARIITMQPNADGPNPHLYNFQMVVNGQPVWVKGTNWCYIESLLRLDRQRNARFIELARNANIHLLRVWGGGPIENDEFYDLCDEMGMMVHQEFSMLGFHRLQNVPSLHAADMTHHMVRRLRNRPSLVIWSGANEISGRGRIVEVLGRRCLELDGTRPFRRSTPFGGDVHWYGVYWGGQSLLDYRKVANGSIPAWSPGVGGSLPNGPIAFTEYGLSSPPNFETWQRIIPEEEWQVWPPAPDSLFMHHTPTWEYTHVELMSNYAREFLDPANLPDLIRGMQLSQGLGLKMLIESMRARKPQTTATYFYKLTENYPACSWAAIDYYGVPKRSLFDVQEANQPIHVMALFDQWSEKDSALPVEIHAVNDTQATVEATLTARLFDGHFQMIEAWSQPVAIPSDRAICVARKDFAHKAGEPNPLFLRLELEVAGETVDRNWYYFNFVEEQGCLFNRPQTSLTGEWAQEDGKTYIVIKNTGKIPALSVELDPGAASNTYYPARSGLWLDPGETVRVELRKTEAVDGETRPLQHLWLSAWNAPAQDLVAQRR